MPNNRMEDFIELIKRIGRENPTEEITEKIIYSFLIKQDLKGFNHFMNMEERSVLNNKALSTTKKIEEYFKGTNVHTQREKGFLWFFNGEIRGNEIKLYIPLDLDQFYQGPIDLFEFLQKENIEHQSKISEIYRNDNMVVRLNTMEDAKKVIDFVNKTPSLARIQKPNPFVPTVNGVGMAMDNTYSYNAEVCKILEQAYRVYGQDLNLENLKTFVKNILSRGIGNLDIKDIYRILQIKLEDFEIDKNILNLVNDKKIDDYYMDYRKDNYRARIIEPEYYLEKAIKETFTKIPSEENIKLVLKALINNDEKGMTSITRQNHARDGFNKYVKDSSETLKNTLKQKGIDPNGLNDDELINKYINTVLPKENKQTLEQTQELPEVECYNILKNAVEETKKAHPDDPRLYFGALKQFITNDVIQLKGFTRTNGARDSVDKMIQKYPSMDYKTIAIQIFENEFNIKMEEEKVY